MNVRAKTNTLVVHCSATQAGLDIGVAEIRVWHKQKGWEDIGYHYVIRRDGTIEVGRPERLVGAHAEGHNSDSIAVCLVGGVAANGSPECNFTRAQFTALRAHITDLNQRYPKTTIQGHRDYPNVPKECPCFNVGKWWTDDVVT